MWRKLIWPLDRKPHVKNYPMGPGGGGAQVSTRQTSLNSQGLKKTPVNYREEKYTSKTNRAAEQSPWGKCIPFRVTY